MTTVYLGLGSNIDDRVANIRKALEILAQYSTVQEVSALYETDPVGYLDQPKFINAACRVSTELKPLQLLARLKEIEAKLGRKPSFRNAPRTIDIDILLFGDVVRESPELTVPHPRLPERAFALVPLVEIAPEIIHPVLKKTIAELLEKVDQAGVVKYKEHVVL